MASRSSVPVIKLARLERTARLAGECFGHEELSPLRLSRRTELSQSRALWWLAACVALIGLVALTLR